MRYKKELKTFIGDSVKYDEYGGGYIWGLKKEGVEMIAQLDDLCEPHLASVRGWGAIQYLFPTRQEQEAFQDELGEFIAEAINDKLKTLD